MASRWILVATAAFCSVTAGAGAQDTTELATQLAAVKAAVQCDDLLSAHQASMTLFGLTLSLPLATSGPNGSGRPMPSYRLQSGDTSVSLIDRISAALSSGDLVKVRRYSSALPSAISRELRAAARSAPQDPSQTEEEDMAEAAYEAGDSAKAMLYANELLSSAPANPRWAGEAIFVGNTVLGRLALQSNNLSAAGTYLLAAGRTFGSPVLRSFGPGMVLALELLKNGQFETVLEYLAECKDFWKYDNGKLDRWIGEIRQGQTPDFGFNLW